MKDVCKMLENYDRFEGTLSDTTKTNLVSKMEENSLLFNLQKDIVQKGDTVVVIGTSKMNTAYKMAELVEKNGSVIIVENDEKYLNSSKEFSSIFEKELGYSNWSFIKTDLEDLKSNPEQINSYLKEKPANNFDDYKQFEAAIEEQRIKNPLIESQSVDLVVLDMTLNRLQSWKTKKVLKEAFRILKPAGRIVASLMLSDELLPDIPDIPDEYVLNIGQEKEIFDLLSEAGFYGMSFLWQENIPVKVIDGVEIRSFIAEGYRPRQVICMDYGDAVIYPGPWSVVYDDDGHKFIRGERMALCEKTFAVMSQEPYAGQFIYIPSYVKVPDEEATKFDCDTPQIRDPRVTKGLKSTKEAKTTEESSSLAACACESYGEED